MHSLANYYLSTEDYEDGEKYSPIMIRFILSISIINIITCKIFNNHRVNF